MLRNGTILLRSQLIIVEANENTDRTQIRTQKVHCTSLSTIRLNWGDSNNNNTKPTGKAMLQE